MSKPSLHAQLGLRHADLNPEDREALARYIQRRITEIRDGTALSTHFVPIDELRRRADESHGTGLRAR